MTPTELEEAVARAIAQAHFGWSAAGFEREARAAIRVVIEAAVGVVMVEGGGKMLTPMKMTLAAAIRRLAQIEAREGGDDD